MTPLQIGASIRTVDSLQEGVSRFYAEITRLRQILQLTGQGGRVVFLIDEMLSGTNSHDRRIGAAGVVKALVERGAVGLVTTMIWR
jgi:DNA mismatch repair ATPase MutS